MTLSVICPDELAAFYESGVIDDAGIHLARTLCTRSTPTVDDHRIWLAIALAVRAVESGSICLPIDQARFVSAGSVDCDEPSLPWPDPDEWLNLLRTCSLVGDGPHAPANCRPLRVVDRSLYLERQWILEETVRRRLTDRVACCPPDVDTDAISDAIDQVFGAGTSLDVMQRQAVATSLSCWTSVIAGGPGTGKTTTIGRLLSVVDRVSSAPVTVMLAAFTGKASARMQQSLDAYLSTHGVHFEHVMVQPASTLHSLLKIRYQRPGYNRENPLPAQIVIVDEMSMVSQQMMADLLDALAANTRLIMVGDPDQLLSVDVGNVLDDVIAAHLPTSTGCSKSAVTTLTHNYRSASTITQLAKAVNDADTQRVLEICTDPDSGIQFIETEDGAGVMSDLSLDDPFIDQLRHDVIAQGHTLVDLAQDLDPTRIREILCTLDRHRVLCAHRQGLYGVSTWTRAIDQALRQQIPGYGNGLWYLGRPIIVTKNTRQYGISNGDTGVVVNYEGCVRALINSGSSAQLLDPWVVADATTMHALTIHKSQGSEYDTVTVVLPDASSRLLSRQLLYTAITRARTTVRLIGTRECLVNAVLTASRRATGLAERLRFDR